MWRTYAAVDARVLFVQVNKNACTSLKWMMAAIAGEDLLAFGPSLGAAASDADDIHDRRQWHRTPRLDQIDPELRAQIHPDNGWFVFAVTRDPRARLISAWQSKLLLDNPGYTSFRKEAWYPRHPVSSESVVEDFAKFVELFVAEPHYRIRGDGHFLDQVELLHEDVVTYTHLYDVQDLGRLQVDLRKHLDQVGWTGELTLPRMNDTPLRANAVAFRNGIEAQVREIYAADFERFPDRWDFATIESVPPWTAEELMEVDRQASQGRRIGYLRDQAFKFRAKAAKERERANKQRKRARRLRDQLDARQRTAPPAPSRSARTIDGLRRRARRWLRRS
jgi:hypothetical protein